MLTEILREQINAQLFGAPNEQAYAIIDGAATPGLLSQLENYGGQHRCLYLGEHGSELSATAPYLVQLKRYSHIGEWLFNAWGQHRGIYAVIPNQIDFETVYNHFRSLMIVNTPDNKSLYFRYYDPRTLRRTLNHCNPTQARKLFGPVQFYLLENTQNNTVQRYWESDTESKTGNDFASLISPEIKPTDNSIDNGPFLPQMDDQFITPEELAWRTQKAQHILAQAPSEHSNNIRLIIDPQQMQEQRLIEESDFIQWYIDDYMLEHLPDYHQTIDRDHLQVMIKNGLNHAIHYGFTVPSNQFHFITLMWKVGANFHQTPEFNAILQNNQLSETERIEHIYQVDDANWNHAMQHRDVEYWFKEAI